MVPLTLLAALVVALTARVATLLAAGRAEESGGPLNLLLHAGIFSFVFSLLGHAISLYQMITAIEAAGGVAPEIVVGGLRVSFIVPLFGLSILTGSLFLWILLRQWRNSVVPAGV